MTALTANRYTKHRDGIVTAHPVKGASRIFKGSIVCSDATGYAVAGADTAGYRVLGIALEEVDNTTGADGVRTIRVQASGVFSLAAGAAIAQADLGAELCVADDQSVALAADTVNDIPVGRLESRDGTGFVWVRLKL